MARAPFCIVEQKTDKGRVFVARFVNEKGRVIKTKTFSNVRSRTQAAREAEALLREGIIANDSNPDALEYLRSFWTRESDYVRSRALRGVVLSEHYLYISRSVLNRHLVPKIKGKKLLDLDTDFIESLVLELSSKGVQPRTINAVIASMRVPMRYFWGFRILLGSLKNMPGSGRLRVHGRQASLSESPWAEGPVVRQPGRSTDGGVESYGLDRAPTSVDVPLPAVRDRMQSPRSSTSDLAASGYLRLHHDDRRRYSEDHLQGTWGVACEGFVGGAGRSIHHALRGIGDFLAQSRADQLCRGKIEPELG